MNHSTRSLVTVVLLACTSSAFAQAFADGSAGPSATDVQRHVAGRVFDVALANGTTWRLQYTGTGYVFVDTSTGFKGDGTWRTEDGRLCSHLRGRSEGCNDVRLHDGVLHLKRDSGEVIRLLPR